MFQDQYENDNPSKVFMLVSSSYMFTRFLIFCLAVGLWNVIQNLPVSTFVYSSARSV